MYEVKIAKAFFRETYPKPLQPGQLINRNVKYLLIIY